MESVVFGLIGFGRWGKNWARLLQEVDGIVLKAVVKKTPSVPDGVILSPAVRVFTDAKAIFSDPAIDCVVIATPAATHFDLARRAIESGKHVLVEKPMTAALAEAEELRRIAAKSDRVCMVGYQYVYNDYVARIREKIQNGEFGNVRVFTAEHLVSPVRKDMGCFLDAGVHALSLVRYLFGSAAVKDPSGVSADFDGDGLDDFASAVARFDRGPIVHITAGRSGAQKTRRMTFSGERGGAVFDETNRGNPLAFFPANGPVSFQGREALRNELEHFVQAVRTGTKPITDAEFGCLIQQWAEEIAQSLRK